MTQSAYGAVMTQKKAERDLFKAPYSVHDEFPAYINAPLPESFQRTEVPFECIPNGLFHHQ